MSNTADQPSRGVKRWGDRRTAWRWLSAILGGVLLAGAFPPIGIGFLAPIAVAATTLATVSTSRLRGAFGFGFITVVLITIILAAIYIFATDIAKAVPQVDPLLSNYVSIVDQGRTWLDSQLQGLAKWLDATAASQNNR